MILRNFLYLDTEALADYLSAIEGYIVEGEIEQKETETKGIKGEAGFQTIVKAGGGLETVRETKQKVAITDAAKFQKLYEILENDGDNKYLDLFDFDTWKEIRRGQMLEIEAKINFPQIYYLVNAMEDVEETVDLARIFGVDPFTDTQSGATFEGMRRIAKIVKSKPLSILFTTPSTPGYSFASNLQRKFIRQDPIDGEATVFGKVQRIILKGEKETVFNLAPDLTTEIIKSVISGGVSTRPKIQPIPKVMTEIIEGPALIINVLAIYR